MGKVGTNEADRSILSHVRNDSYAHTQTQDTATIWSVQYLSLSKIKHLNSNSSISRSLHSNRDTFESTLLPSISVTLRVKTQISESRILQLNTSRKPIQISKIKPLRFVIVIIDCPQMLRQRPQQRLADIDPRHIRLPDNSVRTKSCRTKKDCRITAQKHTHCIARPG
jgi:hypothetical protein